MEALANALMISLLFLALVLPLVALLLLISARVRPPRLRAALGIGVIAAVPLLLAGVRLAGVAQLWFVVDWASGLLLGDETTVGTAGNRIFSTLFYFIPLATTLLYVSLTKRPRWWLAVGLSVGALLVAAVVWAQVGPPVV